MKPDATLSFRAATKSPLDRLRVRAEDRTFSLPFFFLALFTIFYFISPEQFFPVLSSLYIYKVVGGLAFAAVILKKINQGQSLINPSVELRLLLALVVWMIIGIPFSVWPGGSFQFILDRVLKLLVLFYVIINSVDSMERFKKMVMIMVLCGTFLAYTGVGTYSTYRFFIDFIGGWRFIGYGNKDFANPNDLALGLVMLIPLAYFFFVQREMGLKKVFYLGCLIYTVTGVVVTLSRAGMLGLLVVFALILGKTAKENVSKAIAIGLIVLIPMVMFAPERFFYRFQSIADSSKDETGSREARIEGMITGVSIMLQHPLLGVGVGQSIVANAASYDYAAQAWKEIHNIYLQVGVDLGIVGLVLFLAMIGTALKGLREIQTRLVDHAEKREHLLYAQAVEISFWGFCVTAFFAPVAYNWYLYFLLGLSVALKDIVKEVEE